jgi:hypothetical protein
VAKVIEETDIGYAASCDFCSNEIEIQTRDFQFVVKVIKQRGWKISKGPEGEWVHKCPACLEGNNDGRV